MSIKDTYKDDVLNTDVNTQRRYTLGSDGNYTTISDATSYLVTGSTFGAEDANQLATGFQRQTSGNSFDTAITNAGFSGVSDGIIDVQSVLAQMMNAYGVDYITASGTMSNWKYRKWKSGTIEAWRLYSGSVTIQTTSGNLYTSSANITSALPSGLFTSVTYASVDLKNAGVWGSISSADATSIQWRPMSGTSRASATNAIMLYAIGE